MNTGNQSTLGLPDLPGIGEGWELVDAEEKAKDGKCTGERLERIRVLRGAILESLALGQGVNKVAEKYHVSDDVIRAIKADAWRAGELDPLKERLGRKFFALADALASHAMDNIDKIKPDVAILASAQALDKALLVTGAPTARIAVDHTFSIENVDDYIASLPLVSAPVGEEGKFGQKGGAAVVEIATAAADARLGDVDAPARDSQSLVSAQEALVKPANRAENGQIEEQNGVIS